MTDAKVTIEGDGARLEQKQLPPLLFRRVGGEWKYDLSSEPVRPPQQVESLRKSIPAYTELRQSVERGEVTTYEQFEQALAKLFEKHGVKKK